MMGGQTQTMLITRKIKMKWRRWAELNFLNAKGYFMSETNGCYMKIASSGNRQK